MGRRSRGSTRRPGRTRRARPVRRRGGCTRSHGCRLTSASDSLAEREVQPLGLCQVGGGGERAAVGVQEPAVVEQPRLPSVSPPRRKPWRARLWPSSASSSRPSRWRIKARCICSRAASSPRRTRAPGLPRGPARVSPRYASVSERLIRASAAAYRGLRPPRARSRARSAPPPHRPSALFGHEAECPFGNRGRVRITLAGRSAERALGERPRPARLREDEPDRFGGLLGGRQGARGCRRGAAQIVTHSVMTAAAASPRQRRLTLPRLHVFGVKRPSASAWSSRSPPGWRISIVPGRARTELAEDASPPLDGGDLQLDRQLDCLEREQPRRVRAADGREPLGVERRVVGELGELRVDRAPREASARCGQDALRNGIAFRGERAAPPGRRRRRGGTRGAACLRSSAPHLRRVVRAVGDTAASREPAQPSEAARAKSAQCCRSALPAPCSRPRTRAGCRPSERGGAIGNGRAAARRPPRALLRARCARAARRAWAPAARSAPAARRRPGTRAASVATRADIRAAPSRRATLPPARGRGCGRGARRAAATSSG